MLAQGDRLELRPVDDRPPVRCGAAPLLDQVVAGLLADVEDDRAYFVVRAVGAECRVEDALEGSQLLAMHDEVRVYRVADAGTPGPALPAFLVDRRDQGRGSDQAGNHQAPRGGRAGAEDLDAVGHR